MKLSLTYSAYGEMEQIAGPPLREISAAIVSLAEDPLPSGAEILEGQGGCHFLTIDRYYILYHISVACCTSLSSAPKPCCKEQGSATLARTWQTHRL